MGGWHMYDYGFGGFFMGTFLLLLIVLIIYFLFSKTSFGQSFTMNEAPLDILKKRYAKGEISKEQYETMKKDIEL